MAAERQTSDRLIAMNLADWVGARFSGRISGVTRAGLFVGFTETGADGFVPAATLENDYCLYVEEAHTMIGQPSGLGFSLGDAVEVRLVEAVPPPAPCVSRFVKRR